MTESLPLVPVQVGPCRCPGEPHPDGDVVYLYPKLGLEGGIAVQSVIQTVEPGAGRLSQVYLALIDHGIADWTFSNGTGEKLPINPGTVRAALPWTEGGSAVADQLLVMHRDALLAPLAQRTSRTTSHPTGKSSKRGRTSATSTSASPAT